MERGEKKEMVDKIGGRGEEEELMEKVMEFGKRGDGRMVGRVGVWEREEKGKMVIGREYGGKMGVDMGMIEGSCEDDGEKKGRDCGKMIGEY